MNALIFLLTYVLVVVFMTSAISLGLGMVIKKPDLGRRVLVWELKQLSRMGRWFVKQVLQVVADVCHWAHKKL